MSHALPWSKTWGRASGGGTPPLSLVAADGRKVCTVWGIDKAERQETASLILRAVTLYAKAKKKRAEREARMGMPLAPDPDQLPLFDRDAVHPDATAMRQMPGLQEALDVD